MALGTTSSLHCLLLSFFITFDAIFIKRKIIVTGLGLIKGDYVMKKWYKISSAIKLFHACLENAPQSILQMYIIISTWGCIDKISDEGVPGRLQVENTTVADSCYNSNGTVGPVHLECLLGGGGRGELKKKHHMI